MDQATYDQRRKEGYAGVQRRLKALMERDRVDVIYFSYNGYGDSGSIDDVQGYRCPNPAVTLDFPQKLEVYAEKDIPAGWHTIEDTDVDLNDPDYYDELIEVVDHLHPGFEINEGSQGHMIINRITGKVTGEHGENRTVTEHLPTDDKF